MASNRASQPLWRQRNAGKSNAPKHSNNQEGGPSSANANNNNNSTSTNPNNPSNAHMSTRMHQLPPQQQQPPPQSQQQHPGHHGPPQTHGAMSHLPGSNRYCEDDRHTQEAYKRNKGRLIESNPYEDLAEFPDESSLFIGDLSRTVSEEMLMKIFSECGPVEGVDIKRDKVTKNNLGYGFVKFRDRQMAERAKHRMNGLEIGGRAIRIGWAQKNTNLFVCLVGDVEEQITGEHLKEIFRDFGPIYEEDTFVKRNKYGFVKFKHRAHAEKAKAALDGKHLMIPNGYKTAKPVRIGWGDANTQRNCVHVQFEQNSASNADLKEEDFKQQFCKYGMVNKVSLPRYSDKRLKGYGFIHFEENDLGEESAARAITELTASQIKGVVIMCNFGKRQNQRHKRFAQKQKEDMYGDPSRARMYDGHDNMGGMGGGGGMSHMSSMHQQYGGSRGRFADQNSNRYVDPPQNQNGGDYRNNMPMDMPPMGRGNNNGPPQFNMNGMGNFNNGPPPRNNFNNPNMMPMDNQGLQGGQGQGQPQGQSQMQNQFAPPNQFPPPNGMMNAPPSPQMMGIGNVGGVGGNPMMGGMQNMGMQNNPMMNMPPPPPPGPMMMPPGGQGNPNPPLSGPNPFPNPGMFNPMMMNNMPMNGMNAPITVGQLGVPPSPPPPNNMQLPPDPKSFQIHKAPEVGGDKPSENAQNQSQTQSQTQNGSQSLPQFGNFPAPANPPPQLDGSKPGASGPSTPSRVPIGMPNFLPPFAMNPLMNPIGGAMAPQLSPQLGGAKGVSQGQSTSNSPQLNPMQASPPNLFVPPLGGNLPMNNMMNNKFQIPSPNLANLGNLPAFGPIGGTQGGGNRGQQNSPSPPVSPLMHNVANLPFIPSPQLLTGSNPAMPPMNLGGVGMGNLGGPNPMLPKGAGGQMGGLSGKFGAMNLGNGPSGGMHMPLAMQQQNQQKGQDEQQGGGGGGK